MTKDTTYSSGVCPLQAHNPEALSEYKRFECKCAHVAWFLNASKTLQEAGNLRPHDNNADIRRNDQRACSSSNFIFLSRIDVSTIFFVFKHLVTVNANLIFIKFFVSGILLRIDAFSTLKQAVKQSAFQLPCPVMLF
jgi:hypothetical protein